MRRFTRVILIATFFGSLPLPAAEYYDLRLEEALDSDNPKTREWVRSPRLRFTLVDGEAVMPVIELKRGWVVPSWKGVVDSVEVKRADGGKLEGRVTARIHSSIGISGKYDISFETSSEGEDLHGSFLSKTEDGREMKGELRGTVRDVPDPLPDPTVSVWTLQLTRGLPKEETLTLYLNRNGEQFTSGFAFSPNVSRRPMDVDVSSLQVAGDKLSGEVSVTRLNAREPDGGERSVFGEYRMIADLDTSRIRGEHSGTTLEGKKVKGEVWGEIRPKNPLPASPQIWFKLEDGYAGGEMWQNRVFLKATLTEDGKLLEGSAGNNKGVFEASFDAAAIKFNGDHVSGTLSSTVRRSGSVSLGEYTFRIDGIRAGDVIHGRFYTTYAGKEDHSGYFVGGIDR